MVYFIRCHDHDYCKDSRDFHLYEQHHNGTHGDWHLPQMPCTGGALLRATKRLLAGLLGPFEHDRRMCTYCTQQERLSRGTGASTEDCLSASHLKQCLNGLRADTIDLLIDIVMDDLENKLADSMDDGGCAHYQDHSPES